MSIDRDKILSLGVIRGSKTVDRREHHLSKDLDAYKRLRKNGLQPPGIDGSARLETEAVTPLEIQTGVVPSHLPQKERQQLAERLANFDFAPAKFVR